MPSKILTDLAPELIIQILKSSDSFADLTSLSGASRKLFIIWKTNDDAICEAILARSVPCYEQVQELLAAQEKAEGDDHSVFGYQSATDRAKWMLKEAATAARALLYFEKNLRMIWAENRFPVEQAVLTSAERTDFVRAYHRATTLVTLKEEPLPSQMLSSWDILDLRQVGDVMGWVGFYCFGGQLQDLGVRFDYCYSDRIPAGITSGQKWTRVRSFLNNLRWDLYDFASESDQDRRMVSPCFPSIVRDRYRTQDQYRSNRGARLADLLALVREQGVRYNVKYKLSEA